MSNARSRISAALEERLTDEQLKVLMDEVLSIKKLVYMSCPGCKKRHQVEVPDAKAVAGALADLLVQADGRPREQQADETTPIMFKRVLVFSGPQPSPDELAAKPLHADEVHLGEYTPDDGAEDAITGNPLKPQPPDALGPHNGFLGAAGS